MISNINHLTLNFTTVTITIIILSFMSQSDEYDLVNKTWKQVKFEHINMKDKSNVDVETNSTRLNRNVLSVFHLISTDKIIHLGKV